MTTTTFTNAVAVKWNVVDGKEVLLNRKRLWPPAYHPIGLPNDPSNSTGRVIEAFVGDSIKIDSNPTHGFNWLDAGIAIFEVVGGQRVTPAVGPASGFGKETVLLPDGTHGPAFTTMRDDFTIDTHGMKPGTYVLVAALFNEFDSPGVLATIHLKGSLVPGELRIQLPDNPYDPAWTLKTYQVVAGQEVVLIPPKNPLPISDDMNHQTWRHITFVSWNPRTNATSDMLGSNAITSDTPSSAFSAYTFINNGVSSSNRLPALGVDMNALYGPVHEVRLHMTGLINPGFWIVPLNGNYKLDNYDLNNDGLYYLELVSQLPADYNYNPSPPPLAPVSGKIDLDVPDFRTKLKEATDTFNITTPLQYTLPHNTDRLQILVPSGIAPTVGNVEDMLFAALADSNRTYGRNQDQTPGSPGVGDNYPPGGYAMQTRYGGNWVLPPGGQPGDKIYINVGSYNGFFNIAVITLT